MDIVGAIVSIAAVVSVVFIAAVFVSIEAIVLIVQ